MGHKVWEFELDGTGHTIEISHNEMTDWRTIKLDGAILVNERTVLLASASQHDFRVGSHHCRILIAHQFAKATYSLLIDGVDPETKGTSSQGMDRPHVHQCWQVNLEDGLHAVELHHEAGMRGLTIRVDGRVQYGETNATTQAEYPVQVGRSAGIVHVLGESGNRNYDLSIDGRSLTTGEQIAPSTPPKPGGLRSAHDEALKKAEADIRFGWIAALVVCGIYLLDLPAVETPVMLLVLTLALGALTFGIYRKSRACAVLFTGLYLTDRLVAMTNLGKYGSMAVVVILSFYLTSGIRGTFNYHRLTA